MLYISSMLGHNAKTCSPKCIALPITTDLLCVLLDAWHLASRTMGCEYISKRGTHLFTEICYWGNAAKNVKKVLFFRMFLTPFEFWVGFSAKFLFHFLEEIAGYLYWFPSTAHIGVWGRAGEGHLWFRFSSFSLFVFICKDSSASSTFYFRGGAISWKLKWT